jgi:hypothetical protein
MDVDCALTGKLEWAHFLLTEADPSVTHVDYAPEPIQVHAEGAARSLTLNAIVTFNDGRVRWRTLADGVRLPTSADGSLWSEAIRQLASTAGADYEHLDRDDVFRQPLLLSNWSRIIAWLSAARGRSLFEPASMVSALFSPHTPSHLTLGEVLARANDPSQRALIGAATFKLIQDGFLAADLELAPLSPRTKLLLSR